MEELRDAGALNGANWLTTLVPRRELDNDRAKRGEGQEGEERQKGANEASLCEDLSQIERERGLAFDRIQLARASRSIDWISFFNHHYR